MAHRGRPLCSVHSAPWPTLPHFIPTNSDDPLTSLYPPVKLTKRDWDGNRIAVLGERVYLNYAVVGLRALTLLPWQVYKRKKGKQERLEGKNLYDKMIGRVTKKRTKRKKRYKKEKASDSGWARSYYHSFQYTHKYIYAKTISTNTPSSTWERKKFISKKKGVGMVCWPGRMLYKEWMHIWCCCCCCCAMLYGERCM